MLSLVQVPPSKVLEDFFMDIETLSDKLQFVALYLAVALAAAFIVVGLLVWFLSAISLTISKSMLSA